MPACPRRLVCPPAHRQRARAAKTARGRPASARMRARACKSLRNVARSRRCGPRAAGKHSRRTPGNRTVRHVCARKARDGPTQRGWLRILKFRYNRDLMKTFRTLHGAFLLLAALLALAGFAHGAEKTLYEKAS